jgi:hypothetical protein
MQLHLRYSRQFRQLQSAAANVWWDNFVALFSLASLGMIVAYMAVQ